MNILIVEDDEQTHVALMTLVRRMGFEPRGARSASEAMEKVCRCAPEVLITDWDLGSRYSGVDIAALAQDRREHCQVVFCSGNNMMALRRQTQHLNHCNYIRKPTSMARLRREFASILESA